ncbi:MAG TPA: Arc family DNA-binding protein [Pararhizobium sp.]|nr:Arc family DNA-binding protein [Pararhizobium sp.]
MPHPPSFHVRLSPALMKRIKMAAAESERSINAEIAFRLENSFDLADGARQEIRSLLSDALSIIDKGAK